MKKTCLFLAAFLISANISYTCWFGDNNAFHKIFDTDSINDPTLLPLVGFEKGFWMGFSEKTKNPKDANLEDWSNYLKNDISEKDLSEVIYKTDAEKILELSKNKKVLSDSAKKNKVYDLWTKNQSICQSMSNYLIFAKKCEQEAMRAADEWSDTEIIRDKNKISKLIESGLKEAKKQKDVFLQKRYVFQALRMAFYMYDYERVISLFNEYFGKDAKEDYIYFRALEIKAGSLQKKSSEEAAYYYAKVFLNCPDRREICVRSFSVTSEASWNRSFNLCKNNDEKAVFFALRGLQKGANLLEEISNMAEIAPNSSLLEMLIARYISIVQPEKFPTYLPEVNTYPIERDADNSELQKLRKIAGNILNSNTVNKDFWLITVAYLDILNKDTEEAQKYAAEVPSKSKLKTEAEIVRMAAKICGHRSADANAVNTLWLEIQNNNLLKDNTVISDFWNDAISMTFLKNGEKAKSFLVHNSLAALRNKLDLNLIEYLESYLKNSSAHKDYDKFLIQVQCGNVNTGLDMLKEMKAMYYLQRNKLDLAISELEKCSKDYLNNSEFFKSIYVNKTIWTEKIDYPMFDTDIENQKVKKLYEKYSFLNKDYNMLTYIRQLKDLENRAVKESDKAGEYYYLLGLARYNTGVWGWHRPAMYFMTSNFGSYSWWSADHFETETKVFKNYEWATEFYHDVDIAMYYLNKALKSAQDDELKAKIVYTMAMVEKTRTMKNYWDDNVYSKEYYDMFKILKSKYSKTAYYKEVLRECYDFSSYAAKN